MPRGPIAAIPVPTPAAERIVALDFVRGMALFGVCTVNLLSFAFDSGRAYDLDPTEPLRDQVAWAAVVGLFAGKSFTLFSLLFGIGFQLQLERADRRGSPFAPVYRRRLLVLGALGLLHGALLFAGDILFVYSLGGAALMLLRHRTTRAHWRGAVALLLGGGLCALVAFTTIDFGSDDQWPELEHAGYADGPLLVTLRANIEGFVGWLLFSSLMSFNWRVLACLLAGVALARGGLLAPERAGLHRKLWHFGLWLGLPLAAAAVAASRFLDADLLAGALDEGASLLLTAAWLGGCLLWAHAGVLPRFVAAVAATGRMALTNYLGQSIIACILFRWYGLDLFDRLGRASLLAIAVAIWSAQTLASTWWLHRHAMGPLEWLWRRATYGRA